MPIDDFPNEVVERILVFAHQEGQLTTIDLRHVCPRWRAILESRASLWQDTRILRVPIQVFIDGLDPTTTVRTPPRLLPSSSRNGRGAANNDELTALSLFAGLSRDTLKHVEVDLLEWNMRNHAPYDILEDLKKSRSTLESLALIPRERRKRLISPDSHWPARFIVFSVTFVMQCPNLIDVELGLSRRMFEKDPEDASPQHELPFATCARPFRRLTLDCVRNFTECRAVEERQRFVDRASQLRSLSLRNVLGGSGWSNSISRRGNLSLLLQLLATCADTLEELDVGGCSNLLVDLRRPGAAMAFPLLRRFSYSAHACHASFPCPVERCYPRSMEGMAFPKLETIEVPLDVLIAFPCLPSQVIVRLDGAEDCKRFADWLLALDDDRARRLRSLTMLVTFKPQRGDTVAIDPGDVLDDIIHVLSPSHTNGIVVCPSLRKLKMIQGADHLVNQAAGNRYSLGFARLDEPSTAEEWEARIDASGLAAMANERCWLSRRPRLAAVQHGPAGQASAIGAAGVPSSTNSSQAVGSASRCVALTSVEVESCYISADTWALIKKWSLCNFKVTPDPEEMAQLPPSVTATADSDYADTCPPSCPTCLFRARDALE